MRQSIHVPNCRGELLQVREPFGIETRGRSGCKRGRRLRRWVGVERDRELIGEIDVVCERFGKAAGNERQYGRNQQEASKENGRDQIKMNRLRSLALASSQRFRGHRVKLLCQFFYGRECLIG